VEDMADAVESQRYQNPGEARSLRERGYRNSSKGEGTWECAAEEQENLMLDLWRVVSPIYAL
jgi:hypothetical protein